MDGGPGAATSALEARRDRILQARVIRDRVSRSELIQGRVVSIDLRQDPPVVVYRRAIDNHWSAWVALVVLNVLDVITTAAVIADGGSEGNPLMRPLVDGVWPATLVKAAALVLVAWLLSRCRDSRRIEVVMAGATGWYVAVVAWNLTVLAVA